MTTQKKISNQLDWVTAACVAYGLAGAAIYGATGGILAAVSFAAGWAVMVGNFELLKRIGSMLFVVYEGGKVNPFVYVLFLVKFAFWGLVFWQLLLATWLQPIPFTIGTGALLIAGLGLGVKELVYAR